MAKWKEDDAEYITYIHDTVTTIIDEVDSQRRIPDTAEIEGWHRKIYKPVAKDSSVVGKIRQLAHKIPGLRVNVTVDNLPGLTYFAVPQSMTQFSQALRKSVEQLDDEWTSLSGSEKLRRLADLVAWAHGEFVRIHPFVDGNGRMSRILANCLILRYGIPYTLTIRPRPTGDYGTCARASMTGDHSQMEQFLLREFALSISPTTPN